MAAASFFNKVCHPVATFYPDPDLRTSSDGGKVDQTAQAAFLSNYHSQAADGGKVDQTAQAAFLSNYHSQAAKAIACRAAICLLAAGSMATAVATSILAYSYVAVAALVAAFVLKTFWKGAPEDLDKQAKEAMQKGDQNGAIKLINRGASVSFLESAIENEYQDVVKHLLSLGFGWAETSWSARSIEMAQIFVDNEMPLDRGELPSLLVSRLKCLALMQKYYENSISFYVGPLKALDVGPLKALGLYYRNGATVVFDGIWTYEMKTVQQFLRAALAKQIKNDQAWEETRGSLTKICDHLKEFESVS